MSIVSDSLKEPRANWGFSWQYGFRLPDKSRKGIIDDSSRKEISRATDTPGQEVNKAI